MDRFFGILGIALIFGLAFLLSNNRKAINYKTVGMGFLLQVALAVFVFKVPVGQMIFMKTGMFIAKILEFSLEGGRLVFGSLMENYVFALQLVSSLIFMMILVNILYYYGIMQRVVFVLGRAMNKLMSVSGAEALSNVASAFVGQVVAQIMIKPYLAKLTRSELLASMAGSMACISGAIMPIYIGMGIPAHYLLAASVMAAPGALVISKIVYPETNKPETSDSFEINYSKRKRPYTNLFDAISSGASEAIKVAFNVIAMIIALVALVAFIDWILGSAGALFGFADLSLKFIMGKIFAVFAYFMGVPLSEASAVGSLMGTKLVLNEMVAYVDLTSLSHPLSAKSYLIACIALCSFGNFGSIAILIGGVGELAPNQRKNLARLGLRALICGTLTCYMSAAIAGILFK
ncbi:MAG: NupC/NupG family nucleoside CNT transporter [Heliobacteriaceae bacterium]|jgi:CNT family concentrative nucleoside transporter|nr:NupC/NupG family nucleoside CNT transporter [Heliobacteriaceae bacterium]